MDKSTNKYMKQPLDFLLLNLLWLVCSIPLVTIGASTCAAFYVSLKLVNDEDVNVCKMFFKAFKQDFFQGTIMLCITSPSISLGWFIWNKIITSEDTNLFFIAGACVISIILIIFNIYSYPLIARYSNSIKNTLRNSAGICLQYISKTLTTIVFIAIPVALMVLIPPFRIIGIFFVPELIILLISRTAKPIFQTIESTPEPEPEQESETDQEPDPEQFQDQDQEN